MRIITLEEHMTTHALQQAFADGARGAPSEYLRKIQEKLLDLDAVRLADMDAAGIDMQVLSLAVSGLDRLEPATATSLVREANDTMAAAVRSHPHRFAAFAALHLRQPEQAAAELTRCVRTLGFKGALVNGVSAGLFLDDPRFTPFWEAAHALGVPVYLHPAPPPDAVQQAYFSGLPDNVAFFLSTAAWGWHAETGLHVLRLIASGLFDRFPRLQLIIGHMGENLPFSLARAGAILGRSHLPLQRPVADYAHDHLHLTTSGYFTLPPLLCALQVFGADRLLFSVDYPYSTNQQGRSFLDALPLSPADLHKIAHTNAERLLKLPTR